MQWRVHIFQSVVSSVSGNNDPSQLAALNDSPWTVISLARAARKHGFYDVSLTSLSRLHSVSRMEVTDAFHKLREQILTCLASPSELRGGLNIVNSTNLEYFNGEQRAELFRLKGLFQQQLGLQDDARQSYSQAVQICPSYAKSWLSWGEFCFGARTKCSVGVEGISLAVSTIVCTIRAASCGSEEARQLLLRCLWLVAADDDEQQSLANALELYGTGVPEWLWLSVLPQLMEGLTRREGPQVRPTTPE